MLKQITEGIAVYTKAFGLINRLKLWSYFIVPIAISLITFASIFIASYSFSDNLAAWISKIWQWDWGRSTFSTISTVVSYALIISVGVISYKHIIMAVSAPFMSPVSEKIEKHLIGYTITNKHRQTSFAQQLIRGFKINIRNLFKELFVSICIIVAGFIIPLVGNLISSLLLFTVQAYYAGFGNMDYTLERHFSYKESIRFVQANRGTAIGNGVVFMLFLLIPIVGVIIVLPLSVTAASIKTVQLLQHNTNNIDFNLNHLTKTEQS